MTVRVVEVVLVGHDVVDGVGCCVARGFACARLLKEVGPMNEIKDAVDLFSKQTSTINGLWTVYVAATFAAGGFTAIAGGLGTKVGIATALTIAFGAFTFGHWRMLQPELEVRWILREEIGAALTDSMKFRKSIDALIHTASKPYKGKIVHISIDMCVFAAIWIRVFFGGTP
jgi:hypothetical protein